MPNRSRKKCPRGVTELASQIAGEATGEEPPTKTQLMVDAISCLRAAQIQALMVEGYAEMNEFDAALVEEDMAAGSECLPEW